MDERLLCDLQSSYGLTPARITPINGGWLNKLWRISTAQGELLVKQFSLERFRNKLETTEDSLQRHLRLQETGIPCPRILPCGGRAIRITDDFAYMVMTFCEGRNESPASITLTQMRDLGRVCARMKQAFAAFAPEGVQGYPISGDVLYASLWNNYRTRTASLPADAPEAYRDALCAQERILKTLSPAFFDRLEKGIAHEDFTPDNLLFDDRGVTAIIDFDRNQYGFLLHDIGRALLSFALWEDTLDATKIRAFMDGYNEQLPLTTADIADALRITWCIETDWWINPGGFAIKTGKAVRYRDEIVWVTKHWDALETHLDIRSK